MPTYTQYQNYIRPSWAPPEWLFGPVWSILYTLIFISFGYVFYLTIKRQLSVKITIPFALNLLFNFLFTPLQFGLQKNLLAAIDIVLVLMTLVWAMIVIYPRQKWITFINIPYLLWVSFATVLQITITILNT